MLYGIHGDIIIDNIHMYTHTYIAKHEFPVAVYVFVLSEGVVVCDLRIVDTSFAVLCVHLQHRR